MNQNLSLAQERIHTNLQKARLSGRVIMPQDAGFDNARALYYSSINKRPAAIVRAANETDVSRVISFARENGLELAVRSGGHSLAGHGVSEGGIVLDLSEMRKIEIDAVDQQRSEAIVIHLKASAAPMAVAQIRVLGGAMARIPSDATAFAHRKRRIMMNIAAMYERREEADVHEDWAVRFAAALQPSDASVHVSFLGDEGAGRVREAYPGSTWDRLAAIKRRYDPSNFFRLNHNIPPAS
jgi:FAD/FMN-containing dehydrogenase